jgi:hypothetical protein
LRSGGLKPASHLQQFRLEVVLLFGHLPDLHKRANPPECSEPSGLHGVFPTMLKLPDLGVSQPGGPQSQEFAVVSAQLRERGLQQEPLGWIRLRGARYVRVTFQRLNRLRFPAATSIDYSISGDAHQPCEGISTVPFVTWPRRPRGAEALRANILRVAFANSDA